jgi:type IV pilus assembly protein PilQ
MKFFNILFLKFVLGTLFIFFLNICQAQSNTLPQQRINLSFQKIDIRKLFHLLSDLGKINLVVSNSISGNVQVSLHQATWSEAFQAILAQNHLVYLPIGNLIWITSPEELNSHKSHWHADSKSTPPVLHSQVMIEARIVEADQRFARNLGVKLGSRPNDLNTKNRHGDITSPSKQLHLSSDLLAEGLNGFLPASTSITMLSKGATQLLQLELNALEANGNGNIVANPRVVTANGVKALIEQGTELPYQTSNKEGSKIHFRKANLRLEVTPKILAHRQVMMHVEISKDTVGMKTEQGYAIDTKNLKSQITIEDGGTAVIGGIYLHTQRDDFVKIPFLGDLPLIGPLFKHQAKMNDKTELLVFITPSLIEPISAEVSQ